MSIRSVPTIAREYNALFKRQLLHFAAWTPVIDRYEVGDFGAFCGGVFQTLGNIREFGVDPQPRQGGSCPGFSCTSKGTTLVRTEGSMEISAFPNASTSAQLTVSFGHKSGLFVRTQGLSVVEMESVDAVARQLMGCKDPHGRRWKPGWRIVRKVYTAKEPVILGSVERGSSVSLSGRAKALRRLEQGQGSVEVNVNATQSHGLEQLGGTGPIALDLFRARITGRAALVSFAAPNESDEIETDLDDDWDEEPDDDPEALLA